MRIVLATRNAHKVTEIAEALAVDGVEFTGLDALPPVPEVVEDGDTFRANALKKAREVAAATGLPALADDSGLEVDAIGGAPGVHSARYAGEAADDAANRRKLVAALARVPEAERTGRFRCVLALVWPGAGGTEAAEVTVDGACEGTLLAEERGSGGFGYDPLFRPEGEARTFAEMTRAEKAAMSHRGRALAALRPHLEAAVRAAGGHGARSGRS